MSRASAVGGKLFSQAADRYILEVSSKKEGGKWEQLRLEAMKRYFKQTTLSDIQAPQIAAWRDWRLKGDAENRQVTGSTVQREKNLLRTLFTVSRDEWHWMDHNPFRGVSMPASNEPRTAQWD